MVFPLYDDNTDRQITPWVNYAFIALNIFVFVVLQGLGTNEQFTYAFSTVPQEILTGEDIVTAGRVVIDPATRERMLLPGLGETPLSVYLTLFTSMFMHGGIAHIAGNMLFLWIFGDNIEDRLGHVRYFFFYVVCGLIASLAHVFTTAMFDQNSLQIPSLGASGAISGVLGGYILLHPSRRVTVILFRFLTDVPAWVAIGIWFAFQLISGLGVLGPGSAQGGVAYAAHIGGFVAGLVLIKFFDIGHGRVTSKPY
ncbi:MAG TPA: rhomboid family intramembrane serine protease [Pyrinomonadaceae bacterium]|nr:rhomboid family intramembrane serine protease [Pyrinomonadaceae bacterium]